MGTRVYNEDSASLWYWYSCGNEFSRCGVFCNVCCLSDTSSRGCSQNCCINSRWRKSFCSDDCSRFHRCGSRKESSCRIWTKIIFTWASVYAIRLMNSINDFQFSILSLPHKDNQFVLYWIHSDKSIRSFDFHYMHEHIFPLLCHYYQCTCSNLDLIVYPDIFSKWISTSLNLQISPRNCKLGYHSRRNRKCNLHHMDNLIHKLFLENDSKGTRDKDRIKIESGPK